MDSGIDHDGRAGVEHIEGMWRVIDLSEKPDSAFRVYMKEGSYVDFGGFDNMNGAVALAGAINRERARYD